MTNVVVEIRVDNDAFRNEDNSLCVPEIGRVFEQALRLIEAGATYNDSLRDSNGNYCGRLTVYDD